MKGSDPPPPLWRLIKKKKQFFYPVGVEMYFPDKMPNIAR
jgi:hypothetical protein